MKKIGLLLIVLVLNCFVYASELTPTKDEVAKLYVATFNRAPDSAGLEYWVNDSGLTLSQIAQSFFDQSETQTLYPPTVSNRDFIKAVYQNLFNREPDSAGWDYWEEQLNTGAFTKNRFIEAVINGALGDDAVILSNKTEVGLYFAQKGYEDKNKAQYIMQTIDSEAISVQSADLTIDNHFRRAYDEFVNDFNSNLTINFDDSLPQSEQEYVLEFHKKVTAVLSEITGINPTDSFDMIYTPDGHRSWDYTLEVLRADKLPTEDKWFKTWYTIEIAHKYFEASGVVIRDLPLYANFLRYNEFNSQTITSIIVSEYGDKLGFTTDEINFYSIYNNHEFYIAFQKLLDECNVFSIYQTDVNYNMNPTAVAAATHDLLTLYKKDNDFYKNLLLNGYGWNGYEEYKEALVKAVSTLDYEDAKAMLDNFKYFQQIDDRDKRPDINIDIALFSNTDFPNTSINQRFAYDSPDSFIIFGQSYNINENPIGTPAEDIVPDPDLYDAVATVDVYNSKNQRIYHNGNVDIKTDFVNGYSGSLKGLLEDGETYTIEAKVFAKGEWLSDSMKFTYYK